MKKQTRWRGRPPGGPIKKLNVEIRPELREKLDTYSKKNKWTIRTAVETIFETFFGKSS